MEMRRLPLRYLLHSRIGGYFNIRYRNVVVVVVVVVIILLQLELGSCRKQRDEKERREDEENEGRKGWSEAKIVHSIFFRIVQMFSNCRERGKVMVS